MHGLLAALSLSAALSAGLTDWGRGPVQWIMTREEQRAWSQVKTDQQANDFIDLFWARRDPTRGTERNEFKETFDRRVAAVDRSFAAGRKRGALTDMGRLWIVLGPPKESSAAEGGMAGQNAFGGGGVPPPAPASRADGRDERSPAGELGVVARVSARSSFTYDNWLPLGLSKPEIVFIEDGSTHEFKVDPQQANPYGALAKQASLSLVNPSLTSVPDWALRGGLAQKPKTMVVTATKTAAAPKVVMLTGEPGATRLTLLKDINAMQLQGTGDPFAAVTPAQQFAKSEPLGYAFQLCRKTASDDSVKVTLKIQGAEQEMSAPTDELVPEAIRVMPACYAIRGAIPLNDFAAGHYRLELQVEDGGRIYELAQELEVR